MLQFNHGALMIPTTKIRTVQTPSATAYGRGTEIGLSSSSERYR